MTNVCNLSFGLGWVSSLSLKSSVFLRRWSVPCGSRHNFLDGTLCYLHGVHMEYLVHVPTTYRTRATRQL